MGIMYDILHVVKIGDWHYRECESRNEAEAIVRRLSSVVQHAHVESELKVKG